MTELFLGCNYYDYAASGFPPEANTGLVFVYKRCPAGAKTSRAASVCDCIVETGG